jgi:DNA-directed RNA polymerase specialized sigma24 family protein
VTPEEAQAEAAKSLDRIRRHREALDRVLRTTVLRARAAGLTVRRTAELAGISPGTVQTWTTQARKETTDDR